MFLCSKDQGALNNVGKTEGEVQKKLDTLGWIQSTSPDRMAPQESRDSIQSIGSSSGSNKVSNHTESTKQTHHALLKQYFRKDRESLVPQKSAALAASQNVNAHACLPQFDGSDDTLTLVNTAGVFTSQRLRRETARSTALRQSFQWISENEI